MSGAKAGGVTAKPVAVRKSSRKLSTRMDSEVIDAFRLFDRDKDGRVTKAEIIDLIESLDGDPKCPQVKVLIRQALLLSNFCVAFSGQLCHLEIYFKPCLNKVNKCHR